MWLSDFMTAIEVMEEVFGNSCFMSINCSWDGSALIFTPELDSKEYYIYHRKTGRIEKHFKNNWRDPNNSVIVIKEGK